MKLFSRLGRTLKAGKESTINILTAPVNSFGGGLGLIIIGFVIDTIYEYFTSLPFFFGTPLILVLAKRLALLLYFSGAFVILFTALKSATTVRMSAAKISKPTHNKADSFRGGFSPSEDLDASLSRYASLIEAYMDKLSRDVDVSDIAEKKDSSIEKASSGFLSAPARELQGLLLNEYYNQGLRQSSISFNFSILSAVVGFIVILFSVIRIGDGLSESEGQAAAVIGIIAGAVIDAASILFFRQSNQARKLMVDFSEKLRDDNKLRSSLKLIDNISNEKVRNRIQALVTLDFAGINLDKDFLKFLLSEADGISDKESQVENQ